MAYTTAALADVTSFGGRIFTLGDCRRMMRAIGSHAAMGLGAVAAVAVFGTAVTLAAAWIVSATLSANPQLRVRTTTGPAALALAKFNPVPTSATPETVAAHWARARALASALASAEPPATQRPVRSASNVPSSRLPEPAVAQANRVPLPRPHPARFDVARAPANQAAPQIAPKAAPQIAIVTPPPPPALEKRAAPEQSPNTSLALPDAGGRTAVYDIAAHTVYMPNGEKLEAHSGFGDKRDDPRYIKIRMRGPTPPNVYELTMRERLFHGVRAIRLNPVDENKMHGRDGMLAHTYLLGPNGQSNGCVSFKDYRKFLQAFLDGKVDRMVVVPALGDTPWRTAARQGGVRGTPARRYADNVSDIPERGAGSW